MPEVVLVLCVQFQSHVHIHPTSHVHRIYLSTPCWVLRTGNLIVCMYVCSISPCSDVAGDDQEKHKLNAALEQVFKTASSIICPIPV